MNRIYFFMLRVLGGGVWNRLFSKNKMDKPLAGVYINQSASSCSRAFDTLTIRKQPADCNTYAVDRSLWFNCLRQGKLESNEYPMSRWIGIYDEKTRLLRDIKKGRVYNYVPKKKKLLLDNKTYIKIKR
jgi:hypothetical protein